MLSADTVTSLRSINDNLITAEDTLQQQHSKIRELRDQLRTMRLETENVSVETVSSFQNLRSARSHDKTSWSVIYKSMQSKTLGSGLPSADEHEEHGSLRNHLCKRTFQEEEYNSEGDGGELVSMWNTPSTAIDGTLLQTMKLSNWFGAVLLPKMRQWHQQLDDFQHRLARVHVRTADPRVRSFCRDLRRRSRIATVVGQYSSQKVNNQSSSSNEAQFLESEFRSQILARESTSSARRRALSDLNVQVARAVRKNQ